MSRTPAPGLRSWTKSLRWTLPSMLSALGASLAPADGNAVPSGSDVQAEESVEPASLRSPTTTPTSMK